MKKIPYIAIWFVMVLAITAPLYARKRNNQWVDTVTTTTFTSPGDVAQNQLLEAVELQEQETIPPFMDQIKQIIKRVRVCLMPGACSEEERLWAVETANHLLELLAHFASAGIEAAVVPLEEKMETDGVAR